MASWLPFASLQSHYQRLHWSTPIATAPALLRQKHSLQSETWLIQMAMYGKPSILRYAPSLFSCSPLLDLLNEPGRKIQCTGYWFTRNLPHPLLTIQRCIFGYDNDTGDNQRSRIRNR